MLQLYSLAFICPQKVTGTLQQYKFLEFQKKWYTKIKNLAFLYIKNKSKNYEKKKS